MLKIVVGFLGAAVVFAALDAVWLSQVGPKLYKPVIGELLSGRVDLPSAVAFYLLYIAGLTYFAIWPALKQGGWGQAALSAAILALVAYGTYDLTNQATLKVWSIRITLADMTWGAFASATAASAGYWAARLIGR